MSRVCTICGVPVGSKHKHGPKERMSWLIPKVMVMPKSVRPKHVDIKKAMDKLGLK